jgi:hypothetical protein
LKKKKLVCFYHIISVVAEKSHMVTLLDADEGDSRSVSTILLKFKAGFSNGSHLVGENKFELPLADSISVHDDLLRLLFVLGVEFLEQFLDHILGVGNVLNSALLYRDCGDELKSTRKALWRLFVLTLEGTGSMEPTIAAIDGRPNSPAAGWVTSAPKIIVRPRSC